MPRPKRTRRDTNQGQLVEDLRTIGAYVQDTADLGGEVLDLLVCYRSHCIPVEVKQPGCERDLTDDEREAMRTMNAHGVIPFIVTSVEDFLELFRTYYEWRH